MNQGPVQICETVTGETMAELRARRDASAADLVEVRLDGVADADAAGAVAGKSKPVIVTCRPVREGGRYGGDEARRLQMLADAARHDADFVDVEWDVPPASRPTAAATRLIVSMHDFAAVPSDLGDRLAAMRRDAPSAIVKIAVTPKALGECVTLRGLAGRDVGDRLVIAMGARGSITRLCPALFGSRWTYAGAAAPGQFSVTELDDVFRLRAGGATPAVYAVAGAPILHSASPAMHNAAFAYLGLDAIYVPLEADDIDDLLGAARAFGVQGLSVTAPLKVAAAGRAATRSAAVERVGAANTLRWRDARLEAENFDVAGFLEPLAAAAVRLAGRRSVVLGAGGAARAAAAALIDRGAHVEIAARRREAAAALAGSIGARTAEWPPAAGWDLLVNTTPVGTAPDVDATPIAADRLRGGTVYDLVYNPAETRLLREARAQGLEAIGGLGMLVAQARHQLRWWTGRDVPAPLLERAARAFLDSRHRPGRHA